MSNPRKNHSGNQGTNTKKHSLEVGKAHAILHPNGDGGSEGKSGNKGTVQLYGVNSDPCNEMLSGYLAEKYKIEIKCLVGVEAAFNALQSFGKAPVLRDGDDWLFGSRDIIMHCEKKYENSTTKDIVNSFEKLNSLFCQYVVADCCEVPTAMENIETQLVTELDKYIKKMRSLKGKPPSLVELIRRSILKFIDDVYTKTEGPLFVKAGELRTVGLTA
ncbi:hypothetical protein SUGI_1123580 [Cryptomeria japonica]|uniref:uncharacterized protein LOC131067567 isoform X2 n=1 Tax=Cryptomeria japonica TaxID=3369 RepID=UPI002414723E|nr:uncharacterized protein LOC131067567 isoform X2 [Cryptomeria japonica]GLJ52759.1 hypothetical protein SUGI_1123580 [Cryptomeria japonica]